MKRGIFETTPVAPNTMRVTCSLRESPNRGNNLTPPPAPR
jgi:hypothetical protein